VIAKQKGANIFAPAEGPVIIADQKRTWMFVLSRSLLIIAK